MPELVFTEPDAQPDAAYKPEWRECTVTFRQPSGRVLALDGWQYGTLVVHATWDDAGHQPYTVTHLPSLLAVCRFAEVEQATAACERLWAACPHVWAARDVDVKCVPADLAAWCKENTK